MLLAQWIILVCLMLQLLAILLLTAVRDQLPEKKQPTPATLLNWGLVVFVLWWAGAFEMILPFPWR